MSNRFAERRALDSHETTLIREIRERAEALASLIESLPPRRERDMAMMNLEQAVMWGCKAVVA